VTLKKHVSTQPLSVLFSKFQIGSKYLRYLLTSNNAKGHGTHSPFVYNFIREVLNDRTHYDAYTKMETARKKLLADPQVIEVLDLGAGSSVLGSPRRKISDIARHSLKPPKYAQLLYRIARYYQPSIVLELGTCLGITTGYFAQAAPHGKIYTLEGAPALAEQSAKMFHQLMLGNILQRTGNFEETLPAWLAEGHQPDLVFLDGNHQEEPTLRYFQWLADKAHDRTMLILDDIHWSEGMESALTKIQKNPAVRCTIDLFFVGIVIFDPSFIDPVHIRIRF
jgi:predicted O-methyltransferase YrrM